MRLRHIEVFHAIYTTGSITGAARLLYVSQPSVSKVLAHAEQQLGFLLFQRTKGKLIPTPEALVMFPDVDKIYRQVNSLKKKADNINRIESGLINIAITPALGFKIVPQAITKFKAIHPNVNFKIQTVHNHEALQTLLEHKCDVAILYSPPALPDVEELCLSFDEIVLCYPKAQFPDLGQTTDLSILDNQEVISIWESGPLGEYVYQEIEQTDWNIKSSMEVDTYYIAARLVEHGQACCTIDRFTAETVKNDTTGIARFEPPLTFSIKALHLTNKPLPKLGEFFLDFVKEELTRSAT